jgi:hypothetical protein
VTIKLNTYVGQPLERVEEARLLYRAQNPEVVRAHRRFDLKVDQPIGRNA